jgi:hypothetical protein
MPRPDPLAFLFPARPAALAVALFAAAGGLLAQAPAQAPGLNGDRAAGAATVDVKQCKEWLHTLAGPEFEGRGTGQPGFEKAANYVAAHFKALGLEARGQDGTYFQHVPWSTTKVVADKTYLKFQKGDADVLTIPAARLGGNAATTDAAGEVVLVCVDVPAAPPRGDGGGRRMQMPKIEGLDDLDLKGKVALVHVRQQGDDGARNPFSTFAVQQALQGKEAAAIVMTQPTTPSGGMVGRAGAGRGGRANPAAGGARRQPAQPTIGGDDLAAILAAAGMTVDGLAKAPTATPLPLRAQLSLATEEANAPAMNVFAVLPGSDPAKKDEYVVIGSHLDHLGRRGDAISPGADDDGSGTTGVLAVAQMFAKNKVRPARSVLFVCFSGEENGLIGSRFFADNCPIPLSSIVAELQMDMIGRDEEENMEGDKGELAENNRNTVHLVGTKKLAPALHDLCLAANKTAGFEIEYDQEGMFSRSDHANFAQKGVPVAFFFTGLHRDYHQTTDTPDKIHYEKLLRIATWVYDIGFELAMQPGRPEIEPELWGKFRGGGRNRAPEAPAAPLKQAAAGGK